MRLGNLARHDRDREQALVFFQRAAAANPEHVDAHMQAAYYLRDLGRSEDAEKSFARALELAPANFGASMGLGYLTRARGERRRSLAFFERAAAARPEDPEAHLQAAYDLRELGRSGEATSAFMRVLELVPNHLGALTALGYLARQGGDRRESLAWFRRAIDADAAHVDANLQVAYDLRELNELDEATQQFERVLVLAPGHEGAAKALQAIAREATAREATSAQEQALAEAKAAEQAISAAVAARMRDGQRALERSELDVAQRLFAHVLGLAPGHADALTGLGAVARARKASAWLQPVQHALDLGEFDAAARLLDKVPDELTSHEQSQVALAKGRCAEARRQLKRAVELYRESRALNPGNEVARFALGRALLLTLDVDAARAQLGGDASSQGPERGDGDQGQLGKLLGELVLDSALVKELQDVAGALPLVRIRLLRQLLRRNGEQTVPAILPLVALREGGLLDQVATEAAQASTRAIPKRIVQFGDQAEPLPAAQSWRRHHPDYELILFDDASAREIIAANFSSEVLQAYTQAPHPAWKAALFRLAFLFAKGGFCLQDEAHCLASLESIVPAGAQLVAYQDECGMLSNNFLGAVPGHAAIRRALDLGIAAPHRDSLLTRAFAQVVAEATDMQTALEGNVILEQWHYRRIAAEPGAAPRTRAP
jgi:tetratricopeptide (TPR) repeat protein